MSFVSFTQQILIGYLYVPDNVVWNWDTLMNQKKKFSSAGDGAIWGQERNKQ